jgi:hypothetical protein
MRLMLRRHPESRCIAAKHIEVEVARSCSDSLVLCYEVVGAIRELHLPPARMALRTPELWLHTCFEAFVGASPATGYYEFNFAPTTQWAAYRFSSYRNGMNVATEIEGPQIEVRSAPDCLTLQANLKLDGLSDLPRHATWRLGIAAVTEDRSGGKSYWALAHPPGKADFHHSDSFAHGLPPTESDVPKGENQFAEK